MSPPGPAHRARVAVIDVDRFAAPPAVQVVREVAADRGGRRRRARRTARHVCELGGAEPAGGDRRWVRSRYCGAGTSNVSLAVEAPPALLSVYSIVHSLGPGSAGVNV